MYRSKNLSWQLEVPYRLIPNLCVLPQKNLINMHFASLQSNFTWSFVPKQHSINCSSTTSKARLTFLLKPFCDLFLLVISCWIRKSKLWACTNGIRVGPWRCTPCAPWNGTYLVQTLHAACHRALGQSCAQTVHIPVACLDSGRHDTNVNTCACVQH